MKRRAPWLLLLLAAACARPAPVAPPPSLVTLPRVTAPVAEPPKPEVAAEEDEEWISPCKEGTPEHQAAQTELASVSKAIRDLPTGGDPSPLEARLEKLVETRCLAGVGTDLRFNKFQSGLSLKTYWREGGEAALSARLAWDKPGDRRLWIAPSFRKALTKESAPTHPLLPLLCSESAPAGSCGSEAAGWTLRATTALHAYAEAKRSTFLDYSPQGDPPKTHESCKKEALAPTAAKEQAFVTFSKCMLQTPIREDALPLGTFRAPTSGWLVLRGTRGHHNWCEEVRAYDLATGSAYISQLCNGMFVPQGTAPVIKSEKGKLPIDALREAAWMMFLAPTADRSIIVSGTGQHIPDEIDIKLPAHGGFSIHGGGFGSSSGRTTLIFQWIKNGKSIATGTVHWPDADGGADSHATSLLRIAELGLVKGCAPAALPPIPWSARSDKATRVGNPEGYFPAYDEPHYEQLERDLAKIGATRTPCAPPTP